MYLCWWGGRLYCIKRVTEAQLFVLLPISCLTAVIAGIQPGRDLWRGKYTTKHVSFHTWGLSTSSSRWLWAAPTRTATLVWRVPSTGRKSTIRNATLPRIRGRPCARPAHTTACSAAYGLPGISSNSPRAAAHAKLPSRSSCQPINALLLRKYGACRHSCNSKSIHCFSSEV